MEFFDFILDVVHPGKKVGISIDMAPCQVNSDVGRYINRRYEQGRLVVAYINGGLTSIIQVCDLDANKPLKIEIMKLYLRYRKECIEAEWAKTPDQPNRCVAMKIDIVNMTGIIEEAHRIVNERQHKTRSIEKTFRAVGQDPWVDYEAKFKAHLDKLAKLPLYGLVQKGVESQMAAVLEQSPDEVKIEVEGETAEGQVMKDESATSEGDMGEGPKEEEELGACR